MNLPIEPNNPVFLLMQLLTILSQGGSPFTGGDNGKGRDLPAPLKDAPKLLFVPPDQKIAFTPEQKIVPILRSFHKKLEKAIEAPIQKTDSDSSSKGKPSSETLPPSRPQTQRQEAQKTPPQPFTRREAPQSPASVPAAQLSNEKAALTQLVEEVKEALRLAGDKASAPQEAPRIKLAAEKLMPLLDRLLTGAAQKSAVKSLASFTGDRTDSSVLQAKRERAFPTSQESGRGSSSTGQTDAAPVRTPPARSLDESGFSKLLSSTKETAPLPPSRSALAAQEILRNAPFQPTAAAAALSGVLQSHSNGETVQAHTDLDRAVFPVPYFAQPVLSSSRKSKSREEEKEEREEEDEEDREFQEEDAHLRN